MVNNLTASLPHVGNKNSNFQGSSPNAVKFISIPLRTTLIGMISLPLEANFSFKRSSQFKKGRYCREFLFDAVVSL